VEITERELDRLVRAVDETHREGMETMAADVAELHHGEGKRVMGPRRSSMLAGAGIGGAAIAIGSMLVPIGRLVGVAGAQTGDAGVAAFAESVELAAVAAYMAAAQSGKVTTPAVLQAATTFAGHHQEHAAAFGAAAGSAATKKANQKLLDMVAPQVQAAADEKAILEIAYGLENAAAATYLFALGALTSKAALQLTASILPVESQHAIVLGTVLGKPATDKTFLPSFQTQDGAVTPDKFPIA
jgi:Ferritin-like domain